MPLCVPMPWCNASRAQEENAVVAYTPALKFWRLAVLRGEDLDCVEAKLRQLYGTADGHACQALLTTEYRQWKRLVLQKCLSYPAAPLDAPEAGLGAGGTARCRFPSLAQPGASDGAVSPRPLVVAIEAFLPGYHLLYVRGSVDINAHEPVLRVSAREKRRFCDTEDFGL